MTEKSGQTRIELPGKLNSASAVEVLDAIKSFQGRSLFVDARNVTMIGAQCIQILMAAKQFWQARTEEFKVGNLSEDVRSSLRTLGLTAEQIGADEVVNNA